ncbi:putative bis-tetraphosphatase [Myriangium duriaei CBS 260.36]|uniref:Bis-tetraphosphatase n=1 Tax=Myriangium duriaei CBS 260.36 TaxID=1168546 RepID=A0A9P4JAT7_9PEZI|nr:putative bis-tetraphosphatase [Myriangium duriaei CBS 260.36]
MALRLSDSLSTLVRRKYETAKQSGGLVFSETQLVILRQSETGLPFQLRYCPTLAKKPASHKPKTGSKPFDPFEAPTEDLLIANIPSDNPTHILVLNKFPIIPEHFILATKAYKLQTHPLDPDDLAKTYNCLQSWSDGHPDRRLFAFFNSGDESGASQPHRHIQLVPVEEMARDIPEGDTWQPLIDSILASNQASTVGPSTIPSLPLKHYALPLPANPSPETLMDLYVKLLQTAFNVTHGISGLERFVPTQHYNLAMTLEGMAILKRTKDALTYTSSDGEKHSVAVNGTILAGTLMVKGEDEWETLKSDPPKLNEVLRAIGDPVQHVDKL